MSKWSWSKNEIYAIESMTGRIANYTLASMPLFVAFELPWSDFPMECSGLSQSSLREPEALLVRCTLVQPQLGIMFEVTYLALCGRQDQELPSWVQSAGLGDLEFGMDEAEASREITRAWNVFQVRYGFQLFSENSSRMVVELGPRLLSDAWTMTDDVPAIVEEARERIWLPRFRETGWEALAGA